MSRVSQCAYSACTLLRQDVDGLDLDELFNLGDLGGPGLHLGRHDANLLSVEDTWLDPGHVDPTVDLVDRATDESEGQGTHDKVFHLVAGQTRFGRDVVKEQAPVGRWATERHFHQTQQCHLLAHRDLMSGKVCLALCINKLHSPHCDTATSHTII